MNPSILSLTIRFQYSKNDNLTENLDRQYSTPFSHKIAKMQFLAVLAHNAVKVTSSSSGVIRETDIVRVLPGA